MIIDTPEARAKILEQFEFFTKRGWDFYIDDIALNAQGYLFAYLSGKRVTPYKGLTQLPECVITLQ